ncbi:MAG TPA: hypothetical protein VK927_09955, partial [Adhaeribacter sp.]|nr:hypothetical protein [Adhaeribacter sp.]
KPVAHGMLIGLFLFLGFHIFQKHQEEKQKEKEELESLKNYRVPIKTENQSGSNLRIEVRDWEENIDSAQ